MIIIRKCGLFFLLLSAHIVIRSSDYKIYGFVPDRNQYMQFLGKISSITLDTFASFRLFYTIGYKETNSNELKFFSLGSNRVIPVENSAPEDIYIHFYKTPAKGCARNDLPTHSILLPKTDVIFDNKTPYFFDMFGHANESVFGRKYCKSAQNIGIGQKVTFMGFSPRHAIYKIDYLCNTSQKNETVTMLCDNISNFRLCSSVSLDIAFNFVKNGARESSQSIELPKNIKMFIPDIKKQLMIQLELKKYHGQNIYIPEEIIKCIMSFVHQTCLIEN